MADGASELVIERLTDAVLADSKVWKERKKHGVARPLRKWHYGDLIRDGVYDRVRIALGLRTNGQALALIGTELRIRTKEGRFG